MICPKCGFENHLSARACGNCGSDLGVESKGQSSGRDRFCVSCGRTIPWDANTCPYCGHDFMARAAPAAAYETISTGKRILLYLVSLLVPLAGIIIGVIYYARQDPDHKHVGTICLIVGIVAIFLIPTVLAAVLYVMVLGFGSDGLVTPAATYSDEAVSGGRRVTILSISASEPLLWNDVTIQLTDGTSFASWEPMSSDLDDGAGDSKNYSARTLGALTAYCTVYDLGGDGYVSDRDYIVFLAPYSSSTTYEAWLLYQPTAEKIGTGAAWVG